MHESPIAGSCCSCPFSFPASRPVAQTHSPSGRGGAAAVFSLPGHHGRGPLRSRLWQPSPDGGPTAHHKSAIRTIGENALCCANIAPAAACQLVESSTKPDGGGHTKACHPVQHVASNLCFNLLTGQSPGEESPSNDGFVSIHRGLNEASPVVA